MPATVPRIKKEGDHTSFFQHSYICLTMRMWVAVDLTSVLPSWLLALVCWRLKKTVSMLNEPVDPVSSQIIIRFLFLMIFSYSDIVLTCLGSWLSHSFLQEMHWWRHALFFTTRLPEVLMECMWYALLKMIQRGSTLAPFSSMTLHLLSRSYLRGVKWST